MTVTKVDEWVYFLCNSPFLIFVLKSQEKCLETNKGSTKAQYKQETELERNLCNISRITV